MTTYGDAFPTATLLPNGKVLVAGGQGVDYIFNFGLLYDPASDTWTNTGNMNDDREDHTATLLPNGEMLVAGGVSDDGGFAQPDTSAELYDPATQVWTYTGLLNDGCYGHTATLLLP